MLRKISKIIVGTLIGVLCFTYVGIEKDGYELTSYAATNDWSNHWAKNQIQEFIDKGYIGGYSDGTFKPNNSITRAEFVTIFNKAFELKTTSGKVFNDTKTHWAKDEVDKAITNGVCNGKTATEFKPNDPITREEASVMLANYKKYTDSNYDKINIYYDGSQVSSWAKSSVEGLIEKGYIGGYSDRTFRPKGKITRAEAVVTLSRVVSNKPIPKPPTSSNYMPLLTGNVTYGNNGLSYKTPEGFNLEASDGGDEVTAYISYQVFTSPEGYENLKTFVTFYAGSEAWEWVYNTEMSHTSGSTTINGHVIKLRFGAGTNLSISK